MGKSLVINGADFSSVAVETVTLQDGILIRTVSSPLGGGTISGGGIYSVGDTVTLTAQAKTGYAFSGWSDGVLTATRQITVGSVQMTYTALFVNSGEWMLNIQNSNWENSQAEVKSDKFIDSFTIRNMLSGKSVKKIKFWGVREGSVDIIYYTNAPDISHIDFTSLTTIKTVNFSVGVNEVEFDTPIQISNNVSAFGFSNFTGHSSSGSAAVRDLVGAVECEGMTIPSNAGIVFGLTEQKPFEYVSNIPNCLGIDYFC